MVSSPHCLKGVAVHLLAVVRPESRRSPGTRDCQALQDGYQQVQRLREGVDTEIRHVISRVIHQASYSFVAS